MTVYNPESNPTQSVPPSRLEQRLETLIEIGRWMLTSSLLLYALLIGLIIFCLNVNPAWSKEPMLESWGPQTQNLKGHVQWGDRAYRVGPGDILSISVYHQKEFDQSEILVRPDGYASFNGVGEVYVSGKSLEEIRRELVMAISELVIDPRVTLTISQTRPGAIYLAGAVKRPGMYQLNTQSSKNTPQTTPISRTDLRLSNILANAGGVTMEADLSRVKVTRGDGSEVIKVNLWNMLKHGSNAEDVVLQSGDSVEIPTLQAMALSDEEYTLLLSSSIGPGTFPVRVIGEVDKPGVYELDGTSPLLNSAIAKAGGYKPGANKKVIAIRRFSGETNLSTLHVDPNKMDFTLRPNDVVYITEQKIYKSGRYFENVAKILSPFTNASSAVLGYALLSR